MKKCYRNMLSLMLTLMLAVSVSSMAFATEAVIGQTTKNGYTITSVQYAYNEAGVVHLYDVTGETIIATIGSGAKVAVTDGQQDSRTYVQFGATSGWINDEDLHEQLPQTITGEVSGSSAPAQQLTPIQTTPPQQESNDTDWPEEDDSVSEDSVTDEEEAEESAETVGDPEKDHEPIAAMYEDGEMDGSSVAVDVVQLGVVESIILLDGDRLEVETAQLSFGEEIPDEKKLGYVHAPRTGQAGLREGPSKDSKVVTQLKAGQLVAVLALEEDYAHVNVQGQEGWLRLDCLKYLQTTEDGVISSATVAAADSSKDKDTKSEADQTTDTQETDDAETIVQVSAADSTTGSETDDSLAEVIITDNNGSVVETTPHFPAKALLSCKGETDGTTSVNLRNLPTKDSAKAAVWRTGEAVTVLSYQDGWYLVEADGVCGFVMEAFLSFDL